MSACAEVAQRLSYWPPNLTDKGSSPGVSFSFFFFFFFFFFSNIHTSDKLEIFFDHSILVNGVDPWGVHRFLGGINHENGIYSMGQRHECGLGYIIITIYEVLSLQNRVSEWVSAFSPPAILVSLHSRVKTTTNKQKQLVNFYYQNVNYLCLRHQYINSVC